MNVVLRECFCLRLQVSLSSGENRIVTMSMSDKDLSIWDSSLSKWSRWHGQFTMCERSRRCLHCRAAAGVCSRSLLSFIGASSQDIRLTHMFGA